MSATLKCRLCLVQTEILKMYDLYNEENEPDGSEVACDISNLALCKKVEYCTGVAIPMAPKMPSKICSKCFSTIEVWLNFREMCLKSQIYLTSESNINRFNVENINKLRSNILLDQIPIEKLEDDFEEIEHIDDDFEDVLYASNEEYCIEVDEDHIEQSSRCRKKDVNAFFAEHSDLLECLTSDDMEEAVPFLTAENDNNLERYIEHCANSNPEIQELKKKAVQLSKGAAKRRRQNKSEPPKQNDKPKKPSQYMCNICGNVYNKRPLFLYHMRMHSEDRPYQCEICEKAFRIMSELKNHMYRHTGERKKFYKKENNNNFHYFCRPFQCKHCERKFSDRSSRHRHERIHSNSRPYECSVCNKSFTYSAILKNHMKLHTGERDYICAVCDKSFTLQHQLKAHLLTISHKQKETNLKLQGYEVIYDTKGSTSYTTYMT